MTSSEPIRSPYLEGIIRPIPQFPNSVQKATTEPEDLGDCKICSQRADGIHFAVSSCRACAAFFRRTVILKLTYTCKEKGSCPVEKSLRNLCRSCRYTRCLNEGMKIELVQLQRDSIGKKRSHGNTSIDSLFTPNVATSISADFKKSEEKEETLSGSCTILSQMSNGYNLFLKFRKSTNTLVHSTVITPTFKVPKTELPASRFDSAKQVCKVEAHLVTDIVNTYFYPFNILKFEDKKCVIMLRENSVVAEIFNYYEADVCCKNFKEDASVDLDCTSQCIVHTKNE
uniref:Nuclear receptor domain-containing protein n=1 Tax=Caenorhabditis tropicalis TaxID=1561998 RepID=A0A1I7T0R1_9PELO